MSEEWQDTREEDGITLGPEQALEREISKSKALKVERLQLRDQVDRLTVQNHALRNENEALKKNRTVHSSENSPEDAGARNGGFFLPNRWVFFILAFNLGAIGFLLIYLLQNPAP